MQLKGSVWATDARRVDIHQSTMTGSAPKATKIHPTFSQRGRRTTAQNKVMMSSALW